MEQCHTLGKAKGPFLSSPDSYRRLIEYLIEYLIYLTITHSTWPNQSTFWHSSCTSLARTTNATMCVLRSRKGSPGQGLFLSVNTNLELSAYCDSNWASCPSLVDLWPGILSLAGILLSPRNPKKSTLFLALLAEVEYRSMTVTCCELKWLRYLHHSLQVP